MSSPKRAAEKSEESLLELLRKFGTLPLAMTKDEAARQLSIGRTTLDRLVDYGLIRVVTYEPGGHQRILRSEVERFLAERMEEAIAATESPQGPRAERPKKSQASRTAGELAKLDAALKRKR